jgi:hypothetical protein
MKLFATKRRALQRNYLIFSLTGLAICIFITGNFIVNGFTATTPSRDAPRRCGRMSATEIGKIPRLNLLPTQGKQLIAASSCIYDDICKEKKRVEQEHDKKQATTVLTDIGITNSLSKKKNLDDGSITDAYSIIDDTTSGWNRQQHRRETNEAIFVDDDMYEMYVRRQPLGSMSSSHHHDTTIEGTSVLVHRPVLRATTTNQFAGSALATSAKSLASRMLHSVLSNIPYDDDGKDNTKRDDIVQNTYAINDNAQDSYAEGDQIITEDKVQYFPIVGFVYVKDTPDHSRPLPTISNPSCILHYPNKNSPENLYGWFSPVCHIVPPVASTNKNIVVQVPHKHPIDATNESNLLP